MWNTLLFSIDLHPSNRRYKNSFISVLEAYITISSNNLRELLCCRQIVVSPISNYHWTRIYSYCINICQRKIHKRYPDTSSEDILYKFNFKEHNIPQSDRLRYRVICQLCNMLHTAYRFNTDINKIHLCTLLSVTEIQWAFLQLTVPV